MDSISVVERIRCEILRHALTPGSSHSSLSQVIAARIQEAADVSGVVVYSLDRYDQLRQLAMCWRPPIGLVELETALPEGSLRTLLDDWDARGGYASPLVLSENPQSRRDALGSYYATAVSPIQSLVRVPLSGSSRTFGTIDAIWLQQAPARDHHEEEATWANRLLTVKLLAMAGASAFTVLRSRQETLTLADLSKDLNEANFEEWLGDSWDQARIVCETALARLASQIGTFRAAVIRVWKDRTETLDVLARHADPEITWEGWQDVSLSPNESVAGEAYSTGQPVIVRNISEAARSRFSNWAWIQNSGVRSCASYPLRAGGRVIGTLTVFLSFASAAPIEGVSLMETFANSFALFWDRVLAREQELAVRAELQTLQQEHEAARLHERSKVVLHQAKNGWRELQILLNRMESTDGDGRTRELIRRAQGLAHQELTNLLDDESLTEVPALDVAQEIREMVRDRQLQLKDNRIRINLDLDAVPLIRMPIHEFKEVVNNIVANAIWAIRETGRGSGRIEIGASTEARGKQPSPGEDLIIRVRDNGIGIPRDSLDEIFKRGYTTSRGRGGTGLGLFLTKGIVESYGGQISVESRLGEGSQFVVRWPLKWIAA